MTMSSTTLSVSGMSCTHYVPAVIRVVQQVDTGTGVQVDLDKQIVAATSGVNADAVKATTEQTSHLVKSSG